MKKNLLLLTLCFSVFLLSSCDKPDDVLDDLTTTITGHYTNASTSTDIVVNKVNDTTISISLTTGSGSGEYSVAFASVTMNTANSFTLNTVIQEGAVCIGTETFSGTGTHSDNSISLFMTVVGERGDTITPYDCSGTDTENVSATK